MTVLFLSDKTTGKDRQRRIRHRFHLVACATPSTQNPGDCPDLSRCSILGIHLCIGTDLSSSICSATGRFYPFQASVCHSHEFDASFWVQVCLQTFSWRCAYAFQYHLHLTQYAVSCTLHDRFCRLWLQTLGSFFLSRMLGSNCGLSYAD